MLIRDACPACGSNRYKKNGSIRHGKQHHPCKACERQFGATANARRIAEERRTMVEHLLRERISLRGLCRAARVSFPWLLPCMVERFAACPDDLHGRVPQRPTDVVLRRLAAEADAMWSVVKKKANTQWIWLALDATPRQIIAVHVGDRRRDSGKALWADIPAVYREQATFHTDQYDTYTGVIPAERHKATTKHARKTNRIARLHNTLWQRVSRLARGPSRFPKSWSITSARSNISFATTISRGPRQQHYLCSTTKP